MLDYYQAGGDGEVDRNHYMRTGRVRELRRKPVKKTFEERYATQLKEYNEMKLVDLKGSPKQIAWANDIRKKATCWVLKRGRVHAKLTEKVNRYGDAGFWIDNRNDFAYIEDLLRV